MVPMALPLDLFDPKNGIHHHPIPKTLPQSHETSFSRKGNKQEASNFSLEWTETVDPTISVENSMSRAEP
jgi:hypothetical protein